MIIHPLLWGVWPLGLRDFFYFVPAVRTSFHVHLFLLKFFSVSLPFIILAAYAHVFLKTIVHEFRILIATMPILNGICFFRFSKTALVLEAEAVKLNLQTREKKTMFFTILCSFGFDKTYLRMISSTVAHYFTNIVYIKCNVKPCHHKIKTIYKMIRIVRYSRTINRVIQLLCTLYDIRVYNDYY